MGRGYAWRAGLDSAEPQGWKMVRALRLALETAPELVRVHEGTSACVFLL